MPVADHELATKHTFPPIIEEGARYTEVQRRVSGVAGRIGHETYLKEAKVAVGDVLFQWVLEHDEPFPFDTGYVCVTWGPGEVFATAWEKKFE